MPATYRAVERAFEGTGLSLRGGFSASAVGGLPGVASVVLVGNVGGRMWPSFAAGRQNEPDPLDAWTKRIVGPLAAKLGAVAAYPSDKPYQPFQLWAQRAEPVHSSPLGILIHPEYGLWHAYRAALLFATQVSDLPARQDAESPCTNCAAKPCLVACPVSAFDGKRYDVPACTGHLRAGSEPDCANLGCRARGACPIGPEHRYSPSQIAFHMAAFVKSRGGP